MVLPVYLFSKTPFVGVIHIPIIETFYQYPDIDFNAYDALVITSKEAVDALEALDKRWKELPLLCVGEKTAAYARRFGGIILDTGQGYGDDLQSLILKRFPRKYWLYARPKKVASSFAESLREAGVRIDDVVVYETHCHEDLRVEIPDQAVLLFTSPSTIRCFERRYGFTASHRVGVIGETTKAALPVGIHGKVAETPDVTSLVVLGGRLAESGKEI